MNEVLSLLRSSLSLFLIPYVCVQFQGAAVLDFTEAKYIYIYILSCTEYARIYVPTIFIDFLCN